ncbi:MAG: acyltransferase domain-containing protein [Propionibacteriaceae bacterium]
MIASALRRAPLERLGFRPDDAADTGALIARADDTVLTAVAELAERLRARIATFPGACPEVDLVEGVSAGEVFLLAFLATVDDVRAAHRARGIDDDVSWRSLSDLGQQVGVHRQTYGEFGLHTQDWVASSSWAANLFWLGRLQFNLKDVPDHPGRWWVSAHIPASGPLTPELVEHSLGAAQTFFAAHFADCPADAFHCESWLLDPQLAEAVPGSNIAAFQARWSRYGEPYLADDDVLFFVFRRRGEVDLDLLPQDSRLERAVVTTLRSGGHWRAYHGLVRW